MEKVQVGQIWEVVSDCFLTSPEREYKRSVKLDKGEKIEIRYPYKWHFRTADNHYFHVEEEYLLENCSLCGKIWDKVNWNNNAKLDEILKLSLFDKI